MSIRPSPICNGLSRFDCAEAVARSQSWGVPGTAITPEATCWAGNGANVNLVEITASTSCTTNHFLRVHAETEFTLVTPLIAQLLGDQTITAETQVTVH